MDAQGVVAAVLADQLLALHARYPWLADALRDPSVRQPARSLDDFCRFCGKRFARAWSRGFFCSTACAAAQHRRRMRENYRRRSA